MRPAASALSRSAAFIVYLLVSPRRRGPGLGSRLGPHQSSTLMGALRGSTLGPEAQQMADGVAQLRPVETVEMEAAHPARIQLGAELGGERRGDQLAGGGQIVEALEHPGEPRGERGGGARRGRA